MSLFEGLSIIIIPFETEFTRAKVTLHWDEMEVRFCRISVNKQGKIYFQPPSLRATSHTDCFIVLDPVEWKRLSDMVLEQYFTSLKKKVETGEMRQEFYDQIMEKQKTVELDLDEIARQIDSNKHSTNPTY